MTGAGRSTSVIAFVIAAVLVAGCDAATSPTAGPTAAPTNPPAGVDQAAIYATIEREVEAIRELTPTRSVDPVLLDADALRRTLAEASAGESSPDALARRGRLLIALGLLPAGADLEALTTAFQNGQIAGFYRPEDGRLYVVAGAADWVPSRRRRLPTNTPMPSRTSTSRCSISSASTRSHTAIRTSASSP